MSLFHGDSLAVLRDLPPDSVDAVVTDPPYGLAFMGKKWDYDVPSVDLWREVLRVLKPGGHLLSFGGTRTYHRMVVAMEDAGFEIRDQIQWIYGSGFPKSLDVSKAIDKAAGAEREVLGKKSTYREPQSPNGWDCTKRAEFETAPSTDDAKRWQGWATALKPANEPIVLARKPLSETTVAKNVLRWGTGALNIDGSRIGYASEADKKNNTEALVRFNSTSGNSGAFMASETIKPNLGGTSQGRWPANVLFDGEAAAALDEMSGVLKTGGAGSHGDEMSQGATTFGGTRKARTTANSSGGASRFFYVAKSSKKDRSSNGAVNNIHPTCKPTKLMEYLCRLVTPPGGIILDPFMGSGSTGVAAKSLGFNFIGIEREAEYVEIARRRIEHSA